MTNALVLRGLEPTPAQRAISAPMTPAARQRFANALDYAADRRLTLGPISSAWTSMSMADAYLIQRLVVIRKETQGAKVRGHKIGLIADENRRALGMQEMTSGPIFGHQLRGSGDRLSMGTLIRPWLEAEVALLLGSDLRAPVTAADVLDASRAAVPVLEVLDSRVSWKIRSEDSIADLASSGLVYVGEPVPLPSATALERLTVTIEAGGETLRVGHSAAIGGVAQAAARLVNELGRRGHEALAGQLLLTGSFCAATRIRRGATISASFGPLGTVSLRTI